MFLSRYLKWFASALMLSSVGAQAGSASTITDFADVQPTRILFVGNSYLYYNDSLHFHLRNILQQAFGETVPDFQFKSSTISGGRLAEQPVAHLLTPGRFEQPNQFELVILQGHSTAMLSDEHRHQFNAAALKHRQTARRHGVMVALYMTPGYVAPHAQADDEMPAEVSQGYIAAGQALGVPVIPVGLAFAEAYRQRPSLKLHMDYDGTHPSVAGTYLAACVVARSIYGVSLDDVTYDAFGEVSLADARFLQEIAVQVVDGFFARSE